MRKTLRLKLIITVAMIVFLFDVALATHAQTTVQLPTFAGITPFGYPSLVAGVDSAGKPHYILTDGTGQVYMANPGGGGGGAPSTTTYPSAVPANAPSTLAVPQYSDAAGNMLVTTGQTASLTSYVFVRSGSSDVTLSGYFIDTNGVQLTVGQNFTISTTAVTIRSLYGSAFPAGTVGFRGQLSGPVYEGGGGLANGTITAGMTPGAGYPIVPADTYRVFGRGI